MLKKINKLIYASRNENAEVQNKLVSIAEKIKDNILNVKTYLLIDVKEMESVVSTEKVEITKGVGKVELDL